MALEDIFRALEEQANKDIEEVLADAHAHAAVILEEADDEAQRAKSRYLEGAERAARHRGLQEVNAAKLEMRKSVAGVKERALSRAFEAALSSLDRVRDDARYPSIMETLITEATVDVEGDVAVVVDPRDEALARSILAARHVAAEVRTGIETAGGVVVEMAGGRILRRNTLESRLEKYRGVAQADVAKALFG